MWLVCVCWGGLLMGEKLRRIKPMFNQHSPPAPASTTHRDQHTLLLCTATLSHLSSPVTQECSSWNPERLAVFPLSRENSPCSWSTFGCPQTTQSRLQTAGHSEMTQESTAVGSSDASRYQQDSKKNVTHSPGQTPSKYQAESSSICLHELLWA